MKRVLFVCSQNKLRSPTAEQVFAGWPGIEACPPQPMIGQTRTVLEKYKSAGGSYREVVYPGCGHSPHVERPADVATELTQLCETVSE